MEIIILPVLFTERWIITMLEKQVELCMKDVIIKICETYNTYGEMEVYLDNNWCLYSNEDAISLESKCYIDDYPYINDNDEEIYPEFIVNNELELLYRDELIQDVVISCLTQKKTASLEEIMFAINYYDENDCFLKL